MKWQEQAWLSELAQYETCGHSISEFQHGGTKERLRRVLDNLDSNRESGLTEVGLLKLLVRNETAKQILEEPHCLHNDLHGMSEDSSSDPTVQTDQLYSVFDVVEQEIEVYTSCSL